MRLCSAHLMGRVDTRSDRQTVCFGKLNNACIMCVCNEIYTIVHSIEKGMSHAFMYCAFHGAGGHTVGQTDSIYWYIKQCMYHVFV